MTIADVAAHAGVGAGSVSRVLNGSPKVSPATRARVLASIEALGYQPNRLARGLSRGRFQTIAVLVSFFTNPSTVERLRGIVAALEGSEYDLMLLDVESPRHREEQLASLGRRRADGVIVMSLPLTPDQVARLGSAAVSVVLVDSWAPGIPSVVTDDREGGRIATRHLVELGHTRIAFLGEPPDNAFGFVSSARREDGYRETLLAAGLEPDESLVRYAPHDRAEAAAAVEPLLRRPDRPTAVFACSDVQALGVLEAARRAGLDVPADLSVVGFDDVELSAYAGITTVRQPLQESGKLGAQLLLDALEGRGGEPRDTEHRLVPELVVRSTTGPARSEGIGKTDPEGTMPAMARERIGT